MRAVIVFLLLTSSVFAQDLPKPPAETVAKIQAIQIELGKIREAQLQIQLEANPKLAILNQMTQKDNSTLEELKQNAITAAKLDPKVYTLDTDKMIFVKIPEPKKETNEPSDKKQ